MQRLLRRSCHVTNLAREQAVPLSAALIALLERGYDALKAWRSTKHSPHWQKPGAMAVRRDGLAITSCCA
jgi:hypothetical protein